MGLCQEAWAPALPLSLSFLNYKVRANKGMGMKGPCRTQGLLGPEGFNLKGLKQGQEAVCPGRPSLGCGRVWGNVHTFSSHMSTPG